MIDKYEVILWDFDGVILDSMEVRDEGFRYVLREYPEEQVDKLMKYHRENGGLSRYVKFRYFYEEVLEQEITEEKVKELAGQFSSYMTSKLTDQKLLIDETLDYIRTNHRKQTMFVVSGSDQEELRYLSEKLGISTYFKSIYGSPTPKNELVKNIIASNRFARDEMVLIGDSINDWEAADTNDIDFVGYNSPVLKEKCENYISNFAF